MNDPTSRAARTTRCPVTWCAIGPHEQGTAHFAPVIDFQMTGATDVSIDIAEHELIGGRRVLCSLSVGADDPNAEHLELTPDTAYGIAQVVAAMDPAFIVQFAERLAFAALTLKPEITEVGK